MVCSLLWLVTPLASHPIPVTCRNALLLSPGNAEFRFQRRDDDSELEWTLRNGLLSAVAGDTTGITSDP